MLVRPLGSKNSELVVQLSAHVLGHWAYLPCRRCGTVIWNKSSDYCSRACGRAAKSERAKEWEMRPRVSEGFKHSPRTRTGSLKHHQAREWSVRDLEANVWQGSNLAEFVRSHADLFLPEDVRPIGRACRAVVGLGQLRPGRKIKSSPGSWKGWT